MPHDSATPTHRAGTADAAIAEAFDARDGAGRNVVIEKLRTQAGENALGGLEWTHGGAEYRLQRGGPVERVNETLFRVVSTGEIVQRVEGRHGITHHTEHQTPARPDQG
jgi:hypothetical protein